MRFCFWAVKNILVWLSITLIHANAVAADAYDASKSTLSISSVKVGSTKYSNVSIVLGSVVSVGIAGSNDPSYDTYDPSTNRLTIPVVNVGTATYYNVVVTVGKVLSVGASSPEFNLLAAYVGVFTTPSTSTFTITGTAGTSTITGAGSTITGSVTSGVFEGLAALQRTLTVAGSMSVGGKSYSLASSTIDWTDNSYLPRGESGGTEYVVMTQTPTFPTSAYVGDSGPIYTANRYTSSAKTTLNGTVTKTYLVEAESTSTALVTFVDTFKNTSNVTTKVATTQFRITTANAFTRIKETLVDNASNLSMTVTRTS